MAEIILPGLILLVVGALFGIMGYIAKMQSDMRVRIERIDTNVGSLLASRVTGEAQDAAQTERRIGKLEDGAIKET